MSNDVQNFLQKYPHLKFKLQLYFNRGDDQYKVDSYRRMIEKNGMICNMVVKLIPNQRFLDLLSDSIVFQSVTDMDLLCIRIRSIVRDLKPVIKSAPNLTKLTIELNLNIIEDINRVIECLFSITKLDFLDIQIIASSYIVMKILKIF